MAIFFLAQLLGNTPQLDSNPSQENASLAPPQKSLSPFDAFHLLSQPQLWSTSSSGNPKPGILGSAQAYTQQINPASSSSTTIDLSPYQDILENGVRNEADLVKAREFFMLIAPEDAGKIVEAAKNVPVRFVKATAHSPLGSAHTTFDQATDRRHAGEASQITLTVYADGKGANLFTFLHESVHAAKFSNLPMEYQLDLPQIPGAYASVREIFQAVLANKYYDEAMAFSSEVRVAQSFERATGRNIFEFASFQPDQDLVESNRKAYEIRGFEGVYLRMTSNPAYLPYKMAALYLALLRKNNASEFPKWSNLLQLMGAEEKGGKINLSPEAQGNFYTTYLEPLLQKHAWRLGAFAIGMNAMKGEAAEKRDRATAYLQGKLSQAEAAAFLSNDFDFVVTQVGGFMGDVVEEQSVDPKRNTPPETPLHPRPKALPEQISQDPQVMADQVEIFGKEAEFFYKIKALGNQEISQRWEEFLAYAEHCNPETAGHVYGLLLGLQKDPGSRYFMNPLKYWQLGLSLLRSGYQEEGLRQIALALEKNIYEVDPQKTYHKSIALEEGNIKTLLSHGGEVHVELILEMIAEKMASYESSRSLDSSFPVVLSALQKIVEATENPHADARAKSQAAQLFVQSKDLFLAVRDGKITNNIQALGQDSPQQREAEFAWSFNRFLGFCLETPSLIPMALELFTEKFSGGDYTQTMAYRIARDNKSNLDPQHFPKDKHHEDLQNRFTWAFHALPPNTDDAQRQFLWDLYFEIFPQVHWDHLKGLSSLALSAQDAGLRQLGFNLLETPQTTPILEIRRAEVILHHLSAYPHASRLEVLEKTYRTLVQFDTADSITNWRLRTLLEVSKQAFQLGETSLVEDLIRNQGEILKTAKNSITKPESQSSFTLTENKIKIFTHLFEILSQKGGLGSFIESIERDVEQGRNQFKKEILLEILSFLSSEGVAAHEKALLNRLARAAILQSLKSLGTEPSQLKNEIAPLVKALQELPLDNKLKDSLFSLLIERATPEGGVYTKAVQGLESILEASKLVPFLLSSREFPGARTLLLNRIASITRQLKFNSQDYRMMAAFKGLLWACERIAESEVLDPGKRADLETLRQGTDYENAIAHLHALLSPPEGQELSLEAAKATYRQALADLNPAEALRASGPSLQKALEKELSATGFRGDLLKIDDLRKFFVAEAYQDWQKALVQGNAELAEQLFSLWADTKSADYAQRIKPLLLRELACPQLDMAWKRKIVHLLQESHLISNYAKKALQKVQQDHEPEREAMLYELISRDNKSKSSEIPSYWLALLTQLPLGEARAFLNAHQNMKRVLDGNSRWYPDLNNIQDWRLYVHSGFAINYESGRQRLTHIVMGLSLLAKVEEGAFPVEAMISTHPEWNKCAAVFSALSGILELRITSEDASEILYWTRQASNLQGTQLKTLLAAFTEIRKEHEILNDRIRLSQVELPDFFRGHGPLTEHLLAWLYLELPAGQQIELTQVLKKSSNFGEALRIFIDKTGLEKVGQFLSFWPEVPEEIRKELSHLQSAVGESNFKEVQDTLREQLAGNPHLAELLANLDAKPLGSGTIGETYRSAITVNGVRQEVVVKVIPKSKEDKLKLALDRVEKVGKLLELFSGELAGAAQAHRLVEMFSKMIVLELDLSQEARNMKAVRAGHSDSIGIPGVIVGENGEALVNTKVMVQQFVPGIPLAQIGDTAKRQGILQEVQIELLRQALELGVYHSDLQPGNIRLQENTDGSYKIWLLDFGQVGRLDASERDLVQDFIVQVSGQDPTEIIRVLQAMSRSEAGYDFRGLQEDVSRIVAEWSQDPARIAAMVNEIFEASSKRGLKIGIPFLQLLKGLATFEAMAHEVMSAPTLPTAKAADDKTPIVKTEKPQPPSKSSPSDKADPVWLQTLKSFWKDHIQSHGERALIERTRITETLTQQFKGELKPEEVQKLFDRLYDPAGKTFTVRSSSGEVFEKLNHVEALYQMAILQGQGQGQSATVEDFLTQVGSRKGGTLGRFQEAALKEVLKSPIWVERPMGGAINFIFADILSEAAMGRWQHASLLHAGLIWAEMAVAGGGTKKILVASFEAFEAKLKSSVDLAQYKNIVGNKGYLSLKHGLINHAGTYVALAFMQMIATGKVSLKELGKTGMIFFASHAVTAKVMKTLSLFLKGLKGTGLGTVVSTAVDFYVFKRIESVVSSLQLSWDMNPSIESLETVLSKLRVRQAGKNDWEAFNQAFQSLVNLKIQDNEASLILQKYQTRLEALAHPHSFLLHRLLHHPEVIRDQADLVTQRRSLDPKLFKQHAYAISHNRLTELPNELRDYVIAARTQAAQLAKAQLENDAELKSLEAAFSEHCQNVDALTKMALQEQLESLKAQGKSETLARMWSLRDPAISDLLTQSSMLAVQKKTEIERQAFMNDYKVKHSGWDLEALLIQALWNAYPNDANFGKYQQQLIAGPLLSHVEAPDLTWWKNGQLADLYLVREELMRIQQEGGERTTPTIPLPEALAETMMKSFAVGE